MARVVLLLVLVFALAPAARAVDGLAPKPGESRPRGNPDVRIDEKPDAQVPLDLTFRDENGAEVTLGNCVGGKPTILVLAYYRCPMLCTEVLNGLTEALKQMPSDFTAGGPFNVVTVSFDDREQPAQARDKKANYLEHYGRPGAEKGWHFLTGRKEPIKRLTDAVGFRYVYDKVYKEYDHPSGIIVLRPDGRVFRYFSGIGFGGEKKVRYDTPDGFKVEKTTLRLSLVEASDGKAGTLLDQFLMRCYRFDHLEQKYAFNVLLFVRVGGVLTVLALVCGAAYYVRRERRKAGPLPTLARVAAGAAGVPADRPAEGVS